MTALERVSFWHCDKCNRTLNHGELRYNCTICDDYDYCENCAMTTESPHPHRMVPELAYGLAEKHKSRLYDTSVLIRAAVAMYWDRHCMGTRDVDKDNPSNYKDSYSWLTFKTIGDRSKKFGHGLRCLIEPRDYLGICAGNRPEWMITDFACIFHSIISVPIYTLFTNQEITYVINNTQVSVIVCDKEMLPRLVALHSECSSLRHIVCMDPIPNTISSISTNGVSIHDMKLIETYGSTNKPDYISTKLEDCLTIVYTSGSSGLPKGAILSHETLRTSYPRRCPTSSSDHIHFSYGSLAWLSNRDNIIITFLHGGRTGFSTGDPSRLMEELALVRPSDFQAVPAIWNKMYNEFKASLALITATVPSETIPNEEQRLLQQFSKLIPNRCKLISTGGALISQATLDFMKQCFKHCAVNESYGTTECGSVTFNNLLENTLQYRLESVPDMGYTLDDKPYPRGELLTKTSQMFSGYINNPDETRTALTDDGFFRTGDIVELCTDQSSQTHVRVIDRKKNFFKLSQGQFVSPEFLQNIYIQSAFVDQIYIHGDLLADSVSAVVVPNQQYLQSYTLQHSLPSIDMKNCHSDVSKMILEDLRSIATKESLRKHEIPSRIIIDFEPFTPQNGLLTSSMKPCRHKIAAHYADQLKSSNTIEQQLKTLIESVTGQSITSNTQENILMTTGGDSLSAVRLSRLIENNLGIPLSFNILFHPKMNLQQLTTLIQNPSQLSPFSQSITSQLLIDSDIDLNITVIGHKSRSTNPSKIFITGSTGFVGGFMLSELLRYYPSECEFVCVVRCESAMNPLDRIRENLLFHKIWKDDYEERIIPLRGDLSKYHFDLNNEIYDSLARDIDVIFHCGANVNFILPYHQLYASNVDGTREIIQFACHIPCSCIPIQYISTISVLSNGDIVDKEISIDKTSPDRLIGGYAQSKWVAEKLISKASAYGVRVMICRLGLICADSRSGGCNQHDVYTLLFSEMIKMKCYPKSSLYFHFNGLPVDFTARCLVYLSGNEGESNMCGSIYHVINPNSNISFEDVIDGIEKCGIALESVSDDEWKMRLKKMNDGKNSYIRELLFENVFGERRIGSSEKFCSAVCSLECPATDKNYVMKWLNFILQNIIV